MQQARSGAPPAKTANGVITAGILIIAVMVLPLVLLVLAAWRDYQSVKQQVHEEVMSSRDLLHQHALSLFRTHEVIARSIMIRIRGMSWDEIQASREVHDYLAETARQFPQVHSIWLNDAEGNARASSVTFPVPAVNVAHREYYRLLKTSGHKVVVTQPFKPMLGPPGEVFNLSFRIDAPDGSFGGFVGTAISTDYFRNLFRSLDSSVDPSGSASLFRDDGAILVRHPDGPANGTYAGDSQIMSLLHSTDRASLERVSAMDGVWRSYAFARIEGFPVFIGRGVSQETIMARWRRNLLSYIAFFASSFIVLFALGYLAWRQHRMLMANAANLERLVVERTQHLNRALEEKTAFFREVHHRVKNNLQIISSLARLQESHGEDAGHLERRIQAMALVHELLYSRAEATNLDLSEYIPRLCSALDAASERHAACKVEAEPTPIDLERAVPFALILSEAVTNALKHARRPAVPLEVKVSLRRDGEDLVLLVCDNGEPPSAEQPAPRGFGLKLIRALTIQLNGRSEFRQGDGACFELRFPVERPPRAATA